MIAFLIISLSIISFCAFYLSNSKKKIKKALFILFLISAPTILIYLNQGNFESLSFNQKLEESIEGIVHDTRKISEIDPNLIIIYLEKKLEEEPNDLQGWLILARTCMIIGHFQKADLHYKNALTFFPGNQTILLEYSILKKKTGQYKSALQFLLNLKESDPKNIKAREIIIQILEEHGQKLQLKKELKELLNIKKYDLEYLEKIKKKYKLD